MAKPWKTKGLDPSGSVESEIIKVCRTKYNEMLSYLKGTFSGDIESIHDMRVSSRRLLTVMEIFQKYFPAKDFNYHYNKFKQVLKGLGKIRDCDIAINLIRKVAFSLDNKKRKGLELIIKKQQKIRKKRHKKLLKRLWFLKSKKYQKQFFNYLENSIQNKKVSKNLPNQNLRTKGQIIIPILYQNLIAQAKRSADNPKDLDALHKARLAGKKVRYIMEIFTQVFTNKFNLCLNEIKKLIENMGVIHDYDISLSIIADCLKRQKKLLESSKKKPKANKILVVTILKEFYKYMLTERKKRMSAMVKIIKNWDKNRFHERLIEATK